MNSRARAVAVVLIVLTALPTGALAQSAPEAAGGGGSDRPVGTAPRLLVMKAGTFDPAYGPLPFEGALQAPWVPGPPEVGADGRVRFILHFGQRVDPALLEMLRARGISYERYLPDDGIIAAAKPGDLPSATAAGARAAIALHPGLKISPDLWAAAVEGGEATLRVSVLVFTGPAAGATLARAGSVLAFDGRLAFLEVEASRLLALARSSDIEWVERYAAPQPLLDILTRTIAARQASNGAFQGATGEQVWAYEPSAGVFDGLNGSGVTINIADSGIDSTHPGFAGRIVASFGYGSNASCDCTPGSYPHGTHVAGIAAGNGSWRENDTGREEGKYAGVAPGSSLVAQMVFNSIRTPAQYSQDAYSAGAFVNSNSWAASGGGVYTSLSEEYDALVLDANGRDAGTPQMVYVFSAGNSGRDVDTGAPGTGKNVISVGASGNNRGTTADQVAGFSSRGPAADGRVKPDLVAPGESIDSARAAIAGCGGGEDNCSYWWASGTSMSAPAVSGAAALVTQGYLLRRGVSPSAAMVKGLLIAGATPLPGLEWPGPAQGWGRINVARTIDDLPGFAHLMWDENTALAQAPGRTVQTFKVFADGGGELRIVLQWSDVPGVTSSAKSLINDLDLEVRAPDGTLYPGNLFAQGFSTSGSAADRGNNTEVVRIANAARGVWNVTVRVANIPAGEQRFALIATGNVRSQFASLTPLAVEFDPPSPREGDPVAVIIPVFNTGTAYSGTFDVVVHLEGPAGTEVATATVLTVRPGDDFPATFTFWPSRGVHTIRVDVDPAATSGDVEAEDNFIEASVLVRGFEPAVAVVRNISSLTPHGTGGFLVFVGNSGNVDDLLSLSSTGPPGWSVELNSSSAALAAGASRVIAGTVTAPDRALEGEVGTVRVRATSGGNASRWAEISMDIRIAGHPASRLIQGDFAANASPGETISFAYVVENSGNVPLHFTASAAFVPAAPEGFNVTTSAGAFTVDPYNSMAEQVFVSVPPRALASAYRTLVVTVASEEEGTSTELAYQVAVRRLSGFTVMGAPPTLSGAPGETLRYPIEVRNDGNSRETFTVAAVADGGSSASVQLNVENGSLVIAPFATGFATVDAYLRRAAQAGPFGAHVDVTPRNGAPSRISIQGSVDAVHAVTAAAPARSSVAAGGAAVFTATVENAGNIAEDAALIVVELPPGVTVGGWEGVLSVGVGATTSVVVRLEARADARAGIHTLKLAVRPAAGTPFAEVELVVAIDVRQGGTTAAPFIPGAPAGAAVAALVAASVVVGSRRRR